MKKGFVHCIKKFIPCILLIICVLFVDTTIIAVLFYANDFYNGFIHIGKIIGTVSIVSLLVMIPIYIITGWIMLKMGSND